MKRILTFLLVVFSSIVRAQSADELAVKAAEKARFEAQVSKNYEVLNQLLADDLVYVHSNGNTDNKQSYIQSIKDGKSSYNSIDSQELKVRMYGKTAIINGICAIKMNGADGKVNDLKLRYTDVYVKKDKRWQLVTWQSFRMPTQ